MCEEAQGAISVSLDPGLASGLLSCLALSLTCSGGTRGWDTDQKAGRRDEGHFKAEALSTKPLISIRCGSTGQPGLLNPGAFT